MATLSPLEVSNCQSAAEAFNHPLPQVRQFHSSLSTVLDETNVRLRTLVGGSYRQLLETADTILRMNELVQRAENKLERVGQTCSRSSIDSLISGLAKLDANGTPRSRRSPLEWVAKIKVLELCNIVVGRLLRGKDDIAGRPRGENLVIAAKVLVVTRLLSKSVSERGPTQATCADISVVKITRKSTFLRQQLLLAIERILRETGTDEHEVTIIRALSAYSLATSSSTQDVLRFFLQVRSDAISRSFNEDDSSKSENALTLYARTFVYVRTIFPQRVSEQLAKFKLQTLLLDGSVRALEELRLDEFESWFGDDIMHFTPYIRHDDLDKEIKTDLLRHWAEKSTKLLLEGIEQTVGYIDQLKIMVDIRSRILKTWMQEAENLSKFDDSPLTFDQIRSILRTRMTQILESRVHQLDLVGNELEESIKSWKRGFTDKGASLWDQSMLNMELNKGGALFKQEIVARTYGRNEAASRAFSKYLTWRQTIDEILAIIDQLRNQKWDDYIDDIEDLSDLETKRCQLSVDDPWLLQQHLNQCLGQAFEALQEKIQTLLKMYEDSEDIGQISIYILRAVRDIRSELPSDYNPRIFGTTLFALLLERLAAIVVGDHLTTFVKSLNPKYLRGRLLWEGSPELPVQPSPAVFKLLLNLTLSMGQVGGDLWSSKAVLVLKEHVSVEVYRLWTGSLKKEVESYDACTTEKSEDGSDTADKFNDFMKQALFDFHLVFKNAFQSPNSASGLEALESLIKSQTNIEPTMLDLVQASADKYWKKTSLLFGLLA
ncbi:hypothetical protein K3495_g11360 [Podosphaera aphanis]|nr:hypothetical protein K3495_g11360 [Podosphaera aphanis]